MDISENMKKKEKFPPLWHKYSYYFVFFSQVFLPRYLHFHVLMAMTISQTRKRPRPTVSRCSQPLGLTGICNPQSALAKTLPVLSSLNRG